MTDLYVGQKITIGTSVWGFCGEYAQGIYIHDITFNSQPQIDPDVSCMIKSDIGVAFKLVGLAGSNECVICNPEKLYKEIGTAITDSNGIAYIEYTVSSDDLAAYNDTVASEHSLKFMVCITDTKGQTLINNKCTSPITISLEYFTETISIYIIPWGWYSQDGALSQITHKILDIDGALSNVFTPATGYSYIKTDITLEDKYVVLNIRIKRSTTQYLAIEFISLSSTLILVVAQIILIIGSIGIPSHYKITDVAQPTPKEEAYIPPSMQKDNSIKVIENADTDCFSKLPVSPTCNDLSSIAQCLDKITFDVYNPFLEAFPYTDEFTTLKNKYQGIYSKKVLECDPNLPGNILSDMTDTSNQQKSDTGNSIDNTNNQYNSNLPSNKGLTSLAIAGIISATAILAYILLRKK